VTQRAKWLLLTACAIGLAVPTLACKSGSKKKAAPAAAAPEEKKRALPEPAMADWHRRWKECFAYFHVNDFDKLGECYSEDGVLEWEDRRIEGRSAIIQHYRDLARRDPQHTFEVRGSWVADGNRAATIAFETPGDANVLHVIESAPGFRAARRHVRYGLTKAALAEAVPAAPVAKRWGGKNGALEVTAHAGEKVGNRAALDRAFRAWSPPEREKLGGQARLDQSDLLLANGWVVAGYRWRRGAASLFTVFVTSPRAGSVAADDSTEKWAFFSPSPAPSAD
jgi:hypothetical protein